MDDWGLLDKDGAAEPACDACEWDLHWHECEQCGGEGYFDWETLQGEDPLWYDEDDTEPCSECQGKGGWYCCPNPQCKKVVVKI